MACWSSNGVPAWPVGRPREYHAHFARSLLTLWDLSSDKLELEFLVFGLDSLARRSASSSIISLECFSSSAIWRCMSCSAASCDSIFARRVRNCSWACASAGVGSGGGGGGGAVNSTGDSIGDSTGGGGWRGGLPHLWFLIYRAVKLILGSSRVGFLWQFWAASVAHVVDHSVAGIVQRLNSR